MDQSFRSSPCWSVLGDCLHLFLLPMLVVTGNHTGLRLTSFSCLRTSGLISLPLHNAFLVCRCQGGHHPTPRGFFHSPQFLWGWGGGGGLCSMLISAFRSLFDFSHPTQVTPLWTTLAFGKWAIVLFMSVLNGLVCMFISLRSKASRGQRLCVLFIWFPNHNKAFSSCTCQYTFVG